MEEFTGIFETGDGRLINMDNVNDVRPRTKSGKVISYEVTFTNNRTEEIDPETFKDLRKIAMNSAHK